MLVLFSSLFGNLVAFFLTASALIIGYVKWSLNYWSRKGVPCIPPTFPMGHLGSDKYLGVKLQQVYDEAKAKGWKHTGFYFYTNPAYMPLDREYLKNIMSKDFQHFVDRGLYHNEKDDPLSGHLFLLGGKKWRNLRTKLTPTFTSGKMKMMFGTVVECEKYLASKISKLQELGKPIDIKEVLGDFTTDVIASCAFGLESKATENENSPFKMYLKRFFAPRTGWFKRIIFSVNQNLAKKLHLRSIDKDISEFFLNVVKDTVEYREDNNVTRKDFLQLLIELRNQFTMEEIAAQSFVFFLAGFETSSTTMTFALYELAKHPEIQTKVRKEIHEVLKKHNGELTYEAVHELKYMSQVIDETLRKYPPLSFLTRECVQDYQIPDDKATIEKGTRIILPILAIHRDAEYWPEPDKFDPERFNDVNKQDHKPFTYMPFGEGPRLCIGMRFGLVQSKVGLVSVLKDHEFTVSDKTEEPLEFKPRSFVIAAKGEVWLNAKKVN